MKNVNNIINNVLLEATVTRNQILKAIDQKRKFQIETDDALLTVTPNNITTDNYISLTDDDGNEQVIKLDDLNILDDLSDLKEDVKIKPVNDTSVEVTGLETADEKTAEKILDTNKEIILKEEEPEGNANLAQTQAVENYYSWCKENQINPGTQKTKSDILNYTLFINNKPIEVFIDPEGRIKIGGHTIKDKNTFDKIIKFYEDNN